MQDGLKSNESRRIWAHRSFKIEIKKEGPNKSEILKNWFHPELMSTIFNLWEFQNTEKVLLNPTKVIES